MLAVAYIFWEKKDLLKDTYEKQLHSSNFK